ncbi:uncharacterized protein LOC143421111 [Maylandia zebra]|uniref:uncharacterized protein LOC143421111 n=1 Tax=Maylandia zebra TaxID=106582 RepID=UPI00403D3C3B
MNAVLIVLLFAAVGSAISSSEVMQKNIPYSCCQSKALEFDQNCENTWSVNGKTFAHSKRVKKSCVHPCQKIEGGTIVMDECVDLNVTTVCHMRSGIVKEECIHYQSQPCSQTVPKDFNGSCRHQSTVGLALLTAGWIVKQMIS